MHRNVPLAAQIAIVALASSASIAPAFAQRDTALATVAARLGYDYNYLGPEDAVSLSRPGVTVVIRPGERLFDVNDRTEAMDGSAPRFSRDDVYVSESMVRRLRELAERYRAVPSAERSAVASVDVSEPHVGRVPSGTITGLTLEQVPGRQALSVRGKAPAGSPVRLTLIASLSAELPDVVISRQSVAATSTGTFLADVAVAPGYFRGAILTVVASSLPGIASSTARITLKAPNQDLPIPADAIPRSIR